MVTLISHSAAETEALGAAWGESAVDGWLLGLGGELGAGKTQLVRGLARGLGFAGRVQSPTFALVNQYEGGRLPLFHMDLYRLDQRDAIIHAGLAEYLDHPTGVVAVEWFEKWLPDEFDDWRQHRSAGFQPAVSPTSSRPSHDQLGACGLEIRDTADWKSALRGARLRLVWIECVNESERRITYEDFGP